MPAFQPYWGKLAVRNDRGDRENVGIIRSPIRASILPDLTALGVTCSPSQANFLLATVPASGRWPSAEKLYRSLITQRIYVRWFVEEGLRNKLRITIGTPDENEQLAKALRFIAGLKKRR
jgi:histidinol-phosphate/aromatic aminotransferase/cobyric acid decarboxylase-like protein